MTNKNIDGADLWEAFDALLAPYAQKNADCSGRVHPETPDPKRLPYQRDRDRIIHTTAFRRLKGKTQVLPSTFGDHFRNRLSHTIEVAQMARDLARELSLNEDLSEAIALAHDLGHPPFGHVGEEALKIRMKEFNSTFNHNEQSLRIVSFFERRYPHFPGLNLTQEVLLGLRKHDKAFTLPDGSKATFPHLECQLVDIADEITYISADIEDGLRGNFFAIEDLKEISFIAPLIEKAKSHRATLIRYIIHHLLKRLVSDSKYHLKLHRIHSLKAVQQCHQKIITYQKDFLQEFLSLKTFLSQRYYFHPTVRQIMEAGKEKIFQAFDILLKNPNLLPESFLPECSLPQRICDYIAGMTDNFLEDFLATYHAKKL